LEAKVFEQYPSNITREQFALIKDDLENARKKTKPRKLDLYEVFCAVLYILKSGCQWRMLPTDFPKWRSVHEYFMIWSMQKENQPSTLEQVLKKISREDSYRKWKKRRDEFLHN
jgi:transposase